MNCDQKCDGQREQAAMDKDQRFQPCGPKGLQRTVSQEYLDGIREGREYLRRFNPDVSDMCDIVVNLELTLRQGFGKPVADLLRGERDFWKNQIKKGN